MSDIDILREMLTDSMQLTVVEALSGKKQVTLIENTPPVYYEVNIKNIPENVDLIVIKTEAFLDPNKGCQVFKGSKGEQRRADFAIVAETSNEKLIIFIEMKTSTTTSKKSDVVKQFYGAQNFIHYCQIVGQLFWEVPDFLKNYKPRFVRIVAKQEFIRKKDSRPKKTEIHDVPERMLTLKNSQKGFKFNQLSGKEK
jgi:hypothetical protein